MDEETSAQTFQISDSLPTYSYTVILTEDKQQIEQLTLKEAGSDTVVKTIDLQKNEMFAKAPVYFQDVTFDGNTDILVPHASSAYAHSFYCFVWDAESQRFVEAPAYADMSNPVAHTETGQVLTHQSGGQISSYGIYRFDTEKHDFARTHSLSFEPAELADHHPADTEGLCHLVECSYESDGTEKTVQDIYVKGEMYALDTTDPLAAPYFADDGVWELNSDQWNFAFSSEIS